MSAFNGSQTLGGDKQNDDPKAIGSSAAAGKKQSPDDDGTPKAHDSNNTTTATTAKKKRSKARLTDLERELIAKLRSKTETKLGNSDFPLGRTAKHAEQVANTNNKSTTMATYLKTSTQIMARQQNPPPAPRQQQKSIQQKTQILVTQIPPQQETLFSLPKPPTTQILSQKKTLPILSQPQPNKTRIIRPQLPLGQTPKHVVVGQRKQSSTPLPTKQSTKILSQKKSPIPSQPPQKKQIIHPQLPLRRKEQIPSPQPKTQTILPQQQKKKIPPQQQKFQLPTQKQKSLAEQRRREAKKETPITLTEVNMNEKEINESKSLVMCFLSGMGGDKPSNNEQTTGGRKRGCDDVSSLYVDSFQHDSNNRSTAYHYSAPSLSKKGKGSNT
mmetsp:Transcript_18073/g.29358  ORF Transcript_18073/g.29358 Transcript_18073/m.29358 type:complete len:385 (-) Transcript_18073:401-1555(-)